MLIALALALTPADDPPADALRESFASWTTAVEDDLTHTDSPVTDVATDGCTTKIAGERGNWTVDWRTVRTVALEDVFVFLEGPQLKLAVVADVQDQAGQARLRGMWNAMQGLARRCGGEPRVPDEAAVTLP